jgi:ribose transport system substrate-binding protein
MRNLVVPSLGAAGGSSGVAALGRLTPLLAAALLSACSTEAPEQAPPSAPPPPASIPLGQNPGTGQEPEDAKAGGTFAKPRKADGPITIQIVTNGISPFWDPMAVGMQKAADEVGCKADWSGPQNSEVGAQRQMVEAALAKGVDGIALSCIEPKASIPIIETVLAKGVPIITFDSDAPESKRLAYIGTNNVNAGKAAGDAAVKLLPSGGKFVGFVGNVSAQNARERQDGFVAAAKEHGIELLQVVEDNKDSARARRNVEDTVNKQGDKIQGLLGLFSYNAPQIGNVMTSQAGLRARYKIVTFDAEPATLQHLEKGNIDATVVQKPYDFGYLSTKLLYLINRKGYPAAAKEMNIPADGIYDTGVQVITPDSVKKYKEELVKLGVKSS